MSTEWKPEHFFIFFIFYPQAGTSIRVLLNFKTDAFVLTSIDKNIIQSFQSIHFSLPNFKTKCAIKEASLHAEEDVFLGQEDQNTGSHEDKDDETVVIIDEEDED